MKTYITFLFMLLLVILSKAKSDSPVPSIAHVSVKTVNFERAAVLADARP